MNDRSHTYPVLNKSHKGKYPFKLGTTSFIYPDHYVPNVILLGPFVDEIELLLFEAAPVETLLTSKELTDLSALSTELNLTYNIHLPTDISISDPDPVKQQLSIDSYLRIIERVAPLLPTTYTLHVPYDGDLGNREKIKQWQDIVHQNLSKILTRSGVGNRIAVETLDYPFEFIGRIIFDLNLSVCMDLGHLIFHGENLNAVSEIYIDITSIIHLHGVENSRDHLALDRLPKTALKPVFEILRQFTGSVSLEVFSFKDLAASLDCFERCWNGKY